MQVNSKEDKVVHFKIQKAHKGEKETLKRNKE
jgi:hypothetical protein